MKNIYGFEQGKQTEKAIKNFLGLPAEVSKSGQIDAVYNGHSIEIKRGACALYVGKGFNRYRKAQNATERLAHLSFINEGTNKGTALERSEKVAYSIDGTIERTYITSTTIFLQAAAANNAVKLYKYGKGKMLRIVPNKRFIRALEHQTPLTEWKEHQDAKAWG